MYFEGRVERQRVLQLERARSVIEEVIGIGKGCLRTHVNDAIGTAPFVPWVKRDEIVECLADSFPAQPPSTLRSAQAMFGVEHGLEPDQDPRRSRD